MSIPNLDADVQNDFSGGQNAAVKPHAILPNQYAIGVNTTCSSTSIEPRWGIEEIDLDFSNTGDYRRQTGFDVPFERVFRTGNFQALIPYKIGNERFVIYIVGGFLFLIDVNSGAVTVMNPADPVNVYAPRINWSDAGAYTVVFDWPNRPFILDGITITRSDPALFEVPVAVMGAYNQNRLCIANAGIDWTAGDPSGSAAAPDAPVTFLEVLLPGSPYLANVYQIPTANKNTDAITAMGFLQVVDTSTGIGPLLVSTKDAIYSYRTDLPRSVWQGGAQDIVFGSMLLPSTGIVGQRAHTNVGADIIFLGYDGQAYALSMARNDQRRWGQSPMSREVKNFLEYFDISISHIAAVSYYKNKVFITANPFRVNAVSAEGYPIYDYINGGVVVLEMDNNGSLTQQVPPVWAGLWTGVRFTDFAEVEDTLHISGKYEGTNRLFKFRPDTSYDVIGGKERIIRSVIETREYDNKDETVNKELHSLDLGLRELQGNVRVEVQYKPNTVCYYIPWGTEEFVAKVDQCESVPLYPNGLCQQGIRDLTIGTPESKCLPGTNDLSNYYKGVQLRIIMEGKHWSLEYLRLKGRYIERNELETVCSELPEAVEPAECFDYWEIGDGNHGCD